VAHLVLTTANNGGPNKNRFRYQRNLIKVKRAIFFFAVNLKRCNLFVSERSHFVTQFSPGNAKTQIFRICEMAKWLCICCSDSHLKVPDDKKILFRRDNVKCIWPRLLYVNSLCFDSCVTFLHQVNRRIFLSLIKHFARDVWRSGDIAPTVITSALDGSYLIASHSGHFNPKERAPGTHWIEDWVGPKTGLDVAGKKIFCSCQKLILFAALFAYFLINPEDGGITWLRNVNGPLSYCIAAITWQTDVHISCKRKQF
jgi:hypothetical protein